MKKVYRVLLEEEAKTIFDDTMIVAYDGIVYESKEEAQKALEEAKKEYQGIMSWIETSLAI